MFGWGTNQQLLPTRQVEECLSEGISSLDAGDKAWIITPYATMSKLGPIRRGLVEAAKRDAEITFVIRDEPEQVNPLIADMREAAACGVRIGAVHRLHAKIYWFENFGCVLTSANLVDGSFESSTEIGLYVSGGSVFDQVLEWIETTIHPNMRVLTEVRSDGVDSTFSQAASQRAGGRRDNGQGDRGNASSGFCIRCASPIKYDPTKPYCLAHFRSWAQYSNMDYVEKCCHRCGKPNGSSMARPECYACYTKARNR